MEKHRVGWAPGGKKKKVLPKSSFRQRYVEAERRRAAVLQRLEGLNEAARAHPAYRRAATLPNQTFHKASVPSVLLPCRLLTG